MSIRKLCVNEVTNFTTQSTFTAICGNPSFVPVEKGDEAYCTIYNVNINWGIPPTISFSYDVSLEYKYLNQGETFSDYCHIMQMSGSVTLPDVASVCCDTINILRSITCDPANITTTPTSVSAPVTVTFTITNLCSQTIICVEDTTCPV